MYYNYIQNRVDRDIFVHGHHNLVDFCSPVLPMDPFLHRKAETQMIFPDLLPLTQKLNGKPDIGTPGSSYYKHLAFSKVLRCFCEKAVSYNI